MRNGKNGGTPVGMLCVLALFGAATAVAGRVETRLSAWTCDGAEVSVPHTWNAVDGADGQGAYPSDKDNSVAGCGYLRTSKAYATRLADPEPEKR